jgi:hypothetical protein
VLKNPIIRVCVRVYASGARQRMPTLSAHSASVNTLHSTGERIANGSERNEDGACHVPMADRIGSLARGGERSLAIDGPALENPDSFSCNPHLWGLL